MIPIYTDQEALAWLTKVCPQGPRIHETDTSEVSQTDPQGHEALEITVKSIIAEVRREGDRALRRLAAQFGDTLPESFIVNPETIQFLQRSVPPGTRRIMDAAAANIRLFAQAIRDQLNPIHIEHEGFNVGLDYKPVERVACYVPGGRYPLPSTALMTAITADVAGVPDISIVCPVLHPAIAYAGQLAGVKRFYQMGGAQAIAALAYGTHTIDPVDMVVGPGNAYVTEAKRLLQGIIGIDMLAGPSEVAVIADDSADAETVALDILAQAEHDPAARAYLFTPSPTLAHAVARLLSEKQKTLALPDYLDISLGHSAILVLPSLDACIDAANRIAPEHLELLVANAQAFKPKLRHYGALFIGHGATVPFGDYMAGPNHTLPTGRSARFSGCLSPVAFLRPQSWVSVSHSPFLAESTAAFADLEGLTAHAAAARARL